VRYGLPPALALVFLIGASMSQSPIHFQNRQPQSHVRFVLNNGTTDDKPIIDSTLGGVALFDFDNDGFLDLFFTNGARIPSLVKDDERFYNALYRNNHDGTFTDVTSRAGLRGEGYSMGVAAADFNNDGWTDLYVTGVNRNFLYRSNGDGTFTDVTESAGVPGRDSNGKKLWSVAACPSPKIDPMMNQCLRGQCCRVNCTLNAAQRRRCNMLPAARTRHCTPLLRC
jgi:hypothetical protein